MACGSAAGGPGGGEVLGVLMVHDDGRLAPVVRERVVKGVLSTLRKRFPAEILVTEGTRAPGADSQATPVVVNVAADADPALIRSTAAQSRGVLFIASRSPGGGLRSLLGEGASTVPLWVLLATEGDVDPRDVRKRAQASGCWVLNPVRPSSRTLRSIASAVVDSCTGGLRVVAEVTARAGAEASLEWVWELLADPDVEEYTIVGGDRLMVERAGGKIERRDSPAASDEDLIERMRHLADFGEVGRSVPFDRLRPVLDLQLMGRWRAHGEAWSTNPPFLTLRSNMAGEVRLGDLGIADEDLMSLLREAIAGESRCNVVIGATMAAGKTTMCQALLAEVPESERIDTVEDTPELRLRSHGIHPFTFERLTQAANAEGMGERTMADHIHAAKRANTAKLVIGEVRGPGTMAMLDAMSSGLTGCLVTLHSPPDQGVIAKLISYAMSEGGHAAFIHREIALAVHLLVWMERATDRRRIGSVSQVTGLDEESGTVQTRVLWHRDLGDDLARPVAQPVGLVRETYLAAGLHHLLEDQAA